MAISLDLIKEFEGLRLDAYLCPAGVWTVGYGSTYHADGRRVKKGDRLASAAEAEKLLEIVVNKDFIPRLQKIPHWASMSADQQAALLSFAYNMGAGFYGAAGFETITRRLKDKQWNEVPKALMLYVNAGGRRLEGLVRRREAEAKLWERGLSQGQNAATFIPAPPKTVKVGDTFTLTGKAPVKYAGAEVKIWVDQYPIPGAKVRADGVFEISVTLNQPGARTVKIQIGDLIQTFPLSVIVTLISAPPKSVNAGEKFTLAGKAPPQYAGAEAKIWIDQYPLPSAVIGPDGFFTLTTALNQPGARTVKIQVNGLLQLFPLTVTEGSAPSTAPAKGLYLSGSVGLGGRNGAADVQAVQRRLKELGYNISAVDGKIGPQTIGAIRLFQSIIQGLSTVAGDGRVDVNGAAHQWLQAPNAPRWVTMPPSDQAIGYRNRELEETHDHHDYGASWLADAILAIATDYHHTYRERNPQAALFTINDVSLPHGGNTPDHAGHETGLMCDVFLPRKDGATGLPTYDNPQYDRAACRAMLLSIRRHPLFKLAYFNDPALIKEGLCRHAGGHHHHIHFEIKPPIKQ